MMVEKCVHCFCGNEDFLIRESLDGSLSIVCSGCETDLEDYFKIEKIDNRFIVCVYCGLQMFLVKPLGYTKSTQWYYECNPCDYIIGY